MNSATDIKICLLVPLTKPATLCIAVKAATLSPSQCLSTSEGRGYMTPANNRWLIRKKKKKKLNSKWVVKRGIDPGKGLELSRQKSVS